MHLACRLLYVLVASPPAQTIMTKQDSPAIERYTVARASLDELARLAHIPALGSNTQRITEAMTRLREKFNRPLRIEEVARELL